MDREMKLREYLGYFERQDEPGLLVLDDPSAGSFVLGALEAEGYTRCSDAESARLVLASGRSIFVLVDASFSPAMHDILSESAERAQSRAPGVKPGAGEGRLLLVAERSMLASAEREMPIMSRVGMVERF